MILQMFTERHPMTSHYLYLNDLTLFFYFRKFLKCTKCNYYSMCSRAYIEHMINTHGTKNRFTNKYVPCSSRFMECACGFVHIEGNKMGKVYIYIDFDLIFEI